MQFFSGVDKQHAQMRILYGAKGILDHQLLDLVADPCPAPHTGGIDELVGAPLPGEGKFDRIACNPSLGTGQQPILAKKPVDQCRFAHIRPADNRNPHWLLGLLVLPDLNRVALLIERWLVITADNIDVVIIRFGQHIDTDHTGTFNDGIVKIDKPLAMCRRNRHWFSKPELPRLGKTSCTGTTLAFVSKKHDMRAGATYLIGKELVRRRHSGTGIDHHQCEISGIDRAFRLPAHAIFQTAGRGFFQAGRIDDTELQPGKLGIALAAVARNSGLVIDNGVLPADQPVEQCRFADIRPPDDGNGGGHYKTARLLK